MNSACKHYSKDKWKHSPAGSIKSFRQIPFSIFFFCIFLTIWLCACSTVDPKPFIKFNTAANEITAIDAAVDSHTLTVRTQEMTDISSNPRATRNLSLNFDDDDPFKYSFKFTAEEGLEPLFVKWKRLDSGLTELNLAFIEYTSLLASLADVELIKTEDFDQLAADLNGNARSALASLGKKVDGDQLALFSAAASTAAHAYISNKRKEYLKDVITKNQDLVDEYIEFARETVRSLADDIKVPYQDTNRSLLEQWSNSGPGQKRAIAEKIYANSEVTGITLDMLRSIDKTYESLAETHKKLAAGLANGHFSVNDLILNVKRLQKLYKDLNKANEAAEKAGIQSGRGA